jgi:hypothetical protein
MRPPSDGYNMETNTHLKYSPFEVPLNDQPLRTPRKLRVVCVGAGFAGLTLAWKIQHERKLGDVIDFQIYERNVRVQAYAIAPYSRDI